MQQIIEGKRYDTETADEVCSDKYWDGSNHDRNGRNRTLYKTPKGAFFVHHETRWQGERDHLEAVSETFAKELYERLPERKITFVEAFGHEPEEA
ncbi:MAG: hypothetical protein IPN74_20195 [Haliscomenobacter sp.]|nr:hypothetical protein [Haliscomenobacter sp.]